MLRIKTKSDMAYGWITFVTTCGQQHRGPEVLQDRKMVRPVSHNGIEDRTNLKIHANLGIEGLHKVSDLFFGNLHTQQSNRVTHSIKRTAR